MVMQAFEQLIRDTDWPELDVMIIDLPPQDLNMSVLQYHTLQQKVRTALQLLVDSNTLQKQLGPKAQAFMQSVPQVTPQPQSMPQNGQIMQ